MIRKVRSFLYYFLEFFCIDSLIFFKFGSILPYYFLEFFCIDFIDIFFLKFGSTLKKSDLD